MKLLNSFFQDEHGFVITAEVLLIITIACVAAIVGLSEMAISLNDDHDELTEALKALRSEKPAAAPKDSGFKIGHVFSETEASKSAEDIEFRQKPVVVPTSVIESVLRATAETP